MARDKNDRGVEAEQNAEIAKSWGRHHEEAHFRALAQQQRGGSTADEPDSALSDAEGEAGGGRE